MPRMRVPAMGYELAALEREGVRYVVFGAVALALHGLPPKDWGDAQRIARRFGLKE
jgi:hypothetical protein